MIVCKAIKGLVYIQVQFLELPVWYGPFLKVYYQDGSTKDVDPIQVGDYEGVRKTERREVDTLEGLLLPNKILCVKTGDLDICLGSPQFQYSKLDTIETIAVKALARLSTVELAIKEFYVNHSKDVQQLAVDTHNVGKF